MRKFGPVWLIDGFCIILFTFIILLLFLTDGSIKTTDGRQVAGSAPG